MRLTLAILILLVLAPGAHAAAPPWTEIDRALPARHAGGPVETQPNAFTAYSLDRGALHAQVANAPLESAGAAQRSPAIITLPDPTGALVRFRAVESPVMAPALAAKVPDVTTYAAVGVDDPTATARFDITPLGVHASVRSDEGSWYVDPYYRDDESAYVSYFGRDLGDSHGPLTEPDPVTRDAASGPAPAQRAGASVTRREYRLALASDPAYSKYFDPTGTNPTAVDDAKAILMNRVNQIYNDDLAIKMILVGNNDLLKYADNAAFVAAGYPSETTATTCSDTLDVNTTAINNKIGFGNYDIGHIVMGVNGGGVAGLGVVGSNSRGRGCTGVPTPKGDYFAVDYVAHEMGHEFDGNHTFNGNTGSCGGGNRHNATSVEPGSGSSVMAYAGICGNDNLQAHSDPYFSQRSIDEIQAFVASSLSNTSDGQPARNGGTPVATTNRAPEVTAPANVTIPPRTPFTLTGSGTDADGDPLVYLWEQNNSGTAPTTLTANVKTTGPLFRAFSSLATETNPLVSPAVGENIATADGLSRTFPDAAQIAAGNTDAEAGTCPTVTGTPTAAQVDCFSEFLPTAAYVPDLLFRLTARDRRDGGGGVAHADVTIATGLGQPFSVDSQDTPSTAAGGSDVTLNWTLGETAVAPISVSDVKVSFSTDGGLTFPYTVLDSTPNDGTQTVTLPNVATSTGRLRVSAIGNYFFDINDGDITVTQGAGPVSTPDPTTTATPEASASPSPAGTATADSTAPAAAAATATATPSATARPTVTTTPKAYLRPDLALTAKKVKVSKKRRFKVLVRCRPVGAYAIPARCSGTLSIRAKGKLKRVANRRYTVAAGATKVVRLTLRKRGFRTLRHKHRLSVTAIATVGTHKTTKKVTLKR